MLTRTAALVVLSLLLAGCGENSTSTTATDVTSRQLIEGAFSSVTTGQPYSANGLFSLGQDDTRQTIQIDAAIDGDSASAQFREQSPGKPGAETHSVIVTKDGEYLVDPSGRWVVDKGLPFADTKAGWQELTSDEGPLGRVVDFVVANTPSKVTQEGDQFCTGGPLDWEKVRSDGSGLFGSGGPFAKLTGGSVRICAERDASGRFRSPTVDITMSGPGGYTGTLTAKSGGPAPLPAPTATGDGGASYEELSDYFFSTLTRAFTGM